MQSHAIKASVWVEFFFFFFGSSPDLQITSFMLGIEHSHFERGVISNMEYPTRISSPNQEDIEGIQRWNQKALCSAQSS